MDEKIKELNWENVGFFAKFNSRSPKDAFIYDGTEDIVVNAFYNELNIIKNKKDLTKNNEISDNDVLLAAFIANSKLLKMNNGTDVMNTFGRSFRSLEDLQGTLRLGEEYMDISIALRKWNEKVPITPYGEFRCFVHDKQLNAITQYVSNIYFKVLDENKEMIKQKIIDFYENNVKEYIPMDSFVIDFLVLDIDDIGDDDEEEKKDDDDKILIIELNPFYKSAGA
eukprot:170856_1